MCTYSFALCLNPGGAVKHSGHAQEVMQKHKTAQMLCLVAVLARKDI